MAIDKRVMVEIGANVARLQRDMDKSTRIVQGFTSGASSAFKGLGIAIGGYLSFRAITAGLREVSSIISDVTALAGEQELVEKKLATALGFTSKALLEQAAALQQQTAYGDEAIISAQTLIAAFTKSEDATKKATEATLDLAAGAGMNLKDAANLVSKTLGSTTNALSRYGITVEGAVGSTERLESFVKNVTKVFGGQARAEAETYTGKIKQLSNAWGDMKEEIGKAITENRFVTEVIGMVKDAVFDLSTAIKENKDTLRDMVKTGIIYFAEELQGLVEVIRNVSITFGAMKESWLKFRLGTGAIGSDMNTLTKELNDLHFQNIKTVGSYNAVINKLRDMITKMKELKAAGAAPEPKGTPGEGGAVDTGVDADAKKRADERLKWQIDAAKEYDDALIYGNESINKYLLDSLRERLTKEQQLKLQAAEEAIFSLDDFYGTEEDIRNEINDAIIADYKASIEEQKKAAGGLKDWVINGFNDMANTIADWVTTGKANFKDFVNSAIADLTRLIVKMSVFKILGGVGFGELFGLGSLTGKQSGGPVSAHTPYIVGEKGPELFVPKSSGTIIPQMAGASAMAGAGSLNVSVNVINQSGVPMTATQRTPRVDGQRYILDVVMDGMNRNVGGIRDMFGGR